ncbi:hypothetical protein [Actinomadura napierensis]|uniref:Uncharacterized protein n=1 Tax=Actinomadura napierensis TaxID=267854 RepID=A0ABN2YK36_9ACTN
MVDHETPANERTELLAGELYERARTLVQSIQDPPGLTQPEAVRTIAGNLTQAAFRLAQIAEELDACLNRELDAGRLGHHRGDDPVPTVLKAHDALAKATEQSMDLGVSFRRACRALDDIHGTEDDTTSAQQEAAEEQTPTDEHAEPRSAEVQSAAKDFPHRISEVLSDTPASPSPPEHRPGPKPPPPRREM